ncbi:MAG: class I SAM-dependent methyltransferase [Actinobacteria bacterium]|nr:class I SAM-dependent methyltransferase [Actinomycetota bacterium]
MSNVWDSRADAYRTSETHASGDDLDALVELCDPRDGVKILDVATGGGHVARRLREEGAEVVTCDASPGMGADVVCRAEDLPFADGSFDVVVSRIAPHHFSNIGEAVGELARVSNRVVVVEDTLYTSEKVEAAESLRDPTHVRSYSEEEWRDLLESAGLEVERVELFRKTHELEPWLARTGCTGADAERATELLAELLDAGGKSWTDTKILLEARKSQR